MLEFISVYYITTFFTTVSSLQSIICLKIFREVLDRCCNQYKATLWKQIIYLLQRIRDLAFPDWGPSGLWFVNFFFSSSHH